MVADGDNMGALLDKKDNEEAHHKISADLDTFAQNAAKIVEQHGGMAIYTGGDDVLALLPVTTALACGHELKTSFKEIIEGGTLSAGVAIVHYKEPLSTSLARARAAEKEAKKIDGKDAVCIALHTRGGSPLALAQKWDEAQKIREWQNSDLPRGLAYELRELAREWPEGFDVSTLKAEAQRIADKKVKQDGSRGSLTVPDLESVSNLTELSDGLILARFLSGQGGAQ